MGRPSKPGMAANLMPHRLTHHTGPSFKKCSAMDPHHMEAYSGDEEVDEFIEEANVVEDAPRDQEEGLVEDDDAYADEELEELDGEGGESMDAACGMLMASIYRQVAMYDIGELALDMHVSADFTFQRLARIVDADGGC